MVYVYDALDVFPQRRVFLADTREELSCALHAADTYYETGTCSTLAIAETGTGVSVATIRDKPSMRKIGIRSVTLSEFMLYVREQVRRVRIH